MSLLSLNQYVPSLVVQGSLRENQTGLERSLARIASGYRIRSAADDAAGVALSARYEARARSFEVAERNIATATEMASTAESGAAGIVDALTRLRELAVEASDGALTSTDRGALDVEFQALVDEVDRLAETTVFNGTSLLSGATNTIDFQVGVDATSNDRISVAFGGVSASNLGIGSAAVAGSSASAATSAITSIDSALASIGTTRARFGAAVSRFGFASSNAQSMRTSLTASVSAIRDADVAAEASLVARYQVLLDAGASALASANGITGSLVTILLDL